MVPMFETAWVGQRITCARDTLIVTFSGLSVHVPEGGNCVVEQGAMLSIFNASGVPICLMPLIDVAESFPCRSCADEEESLDVWDFDVPSARTLN
ncbi:hypothetical protein ACUXPM_005329 [Ralstonia sp. 151470066-2]|jgi:hypothetical protein|uniref:Uncharacterized protein n=6 Tax=Pseudomonadota TaxID=1224 RepID=A0AAD2BS39_9RALS|nr:hypothetical protein TK49_23595 [Ralstonia mannitolilytica]MBA9871345.1 hypothetical protein [Ralstonia insidiosa]MBB0026461.1 hypothetical protein [Ralstonia pickettii]MDH6644647.1 hypothetical protein [Ralstonia sp. GP73]CAJ0804615.1 hypothetical protein R77560_04104 [Ralstonia sp. LMG 18095]